MTVFMEYKLVMFSGVFKYGNMRGALTGTGLRPNAPTVVPVRSLSAPGLKAEKQNAQRSAAHPEI